MFLMNFITSVSLLPSLRNLLLGCLEEPHVRCICHTPSSSTNTLYIRYAGCVLFSDYNRITMFLHLKFFRDNRQMTAVDYDRALK